MKIQLSFILFFVFLFCSSQEIADKEKFKKCRKEFSKKICLSDEDKDSVLFYLDECPKVFGVAENNGCAWKDTDNDGIVDKDDVCVDVVGPSENKGCPWPDTDGDGILDKDDKYPTIPDSAVGKGFIDTDNDGVEDRIDNCPVVPGPKTNNGCPVCTQG
ncbi:thrombospondin type 3 repeat-containing protein [Epilithonimonas xixisoli]|uniref:Thrombospondin type 3 repeat-containing protein n=1 Tax=Epilithonimonas xixisoli TaxID=1476462 RepID=A0A4R8I6J2_9FLAO|nr:thrombospondin type 3 repeat-containing protein [Epilithonimonas xixisoli]TDX84583.1 thrombospondin type 3 repeat-containing protein [Epilithonimonas xixisoli]